MNRRDFIIKNGQIMTVAMFMNFMDTTSIFASNNNADDHKRPSLEGLVTPILKAIALGVNAPSPHNTQSWKFKILNDTELLFYVDEHKLLPATDPPSRQIHIGAGCFIETLAIGVTSLGYKAQVQYFPEGYANAADFGKKPVAKIVLEKTSEPKNELSDYISKRQTNRGVYKGEIITATEWAELLKITGVTHSKTHFINKAADMKPYQDIFYKALEIESKTFATNEETRKMFRFSEQERAQKRDGISIPQMGFKGMMLKLAENSLNNGDSEKWHSAKSINASLKNVVKGLDSSKGIILWQTDANEVMDWVKTGRDYVRFSLAATKNNFYCHPYNQAIQEYDEMKTLRQELDTLVGIKGTEKIQMIVRIGRADEPYLSYRREVKDYIIA